MRKVLSVLLTVVLMASMAFAFTGCGGAKANYDSPIKAVEAYKNGENIVGKYVSVTANMNYASTLGGEGMIYTYTSTAPMQIMVCPTNNSGSDVTSGQTVRFRISSVDDSRSYVYVLRGTVVE